MRVSLKVSASIRKRRWSRQIQNSQTNGWGMEWFGRFSVVVEETLTAIIDYLIKTSGNDIDIFVTHRLFGQYAINYHAVCEVRCNESLYIVYIKRLRESELALLKYAVVALI